MQEVTFVFDDVFDQYVRHEGSCLFHKWFSEDTRAAAFRESRRQIRDLLSRMLQSRFGAEPQFVERADNGEIVELGIDAQLFSDELIVAIFSFLRDNAPSYCVQLDIIDFAEGWSSKIIGKVAISFQRFRVSGKVKEFFKNKCARRLRLGEWPLMFDEAPSPDQPAAS